MLQLSLPVVAASVGAAIITWGVVGWLLTRNTLRNMTAIEAANASIAEAERKAVRPKPVELLRLALKARGYQGDLSPVLILMVFVYLLCTVAFLVLGINSIVGAVLAVPASAAVAYLLAEQVVVRRKRKFNVQLLQALTLLGAQIEAGNSPQRSIEQIIPSLQDPIRTELTAAMDATLVTKDLVVALKTLQERYPSRAFQMFIAALEIDQVNGGRLAPALQQAATTLQRSFDLSKEASAELSQQKGEFFAITAIITGVIVAMVTGNGAEATDAYLQPMGFIICCVALANAGLGIYRGVRIFGKVKGEL